jgi:holo-[acyl-carrier protein] synthase
MALGNIIGIGTDMVDARRIEAAIARHGERFLHRIYTLSERAYCASATDETRQLLRYASRFAAKEATYKALGGGRGMSWLDAEVVHTASGAPQLMLHGTAKSRAKEAIAYLSLTDEYPYASAFVIITAKE